MYTRWFQAGAGFGVRGSVVEHQKVTPGPGPWCKRVSQVRWMKNCPATRSWALRTVSGYRNVALTLPGASSAVGPDFTATCPPMIRNRAAELFNAIGQNRDAGISRNRSAIFSGAELDDLVTWIDSTAPEQVVSHLPEADVSHPGGGWVWDRYSPQRLMEFEVEVYGRACEAYDEALARSFARLGWSMPSSAPCAVRRRPGSAVRWT